MIKVIFQRRYVHETSNEISVKYRTSQTLAGGQTATIGFQNAGGGGATATSVGCNARILDDNNNDAGWSISPLPICGNGIIEIKEQCDDNNTNNGDGCSSTCQIQATPTPTATATPTPTATATPTPTATITPTATLTAVRRRRRSPRRRRSRPRRTSRRRPPS
jgi:cysteine-rich repeat protein